MSSQITLIISIAMVILFSMAILGFSIGFANDNDAAISISDNSKASAVYRLSGENVSKFKEETEGTYQSILDTTVEPGSDIVPSSAPFAITSGSLRGSLENMIELPINYIFGGLGSPFGVFFLTFFSIIFLMFALYIIKTWRGNP